MYQFKVDAQNIPEIWVMASLVTLWQASHEREREGGLRICISKLKCLISRAFLNIWFPVAHNWKSMQSEHLKAAWQDLPMFQVIKRHRIQLQLCLKKKMTTARRPTDISFTSCIIVLKEERQGNSGNKFPIYFQEQKTKTKIICNKKDTTRRREGWEKEAYQVRALSHGLPDITVYRI